MGSVVWFTLGSGGRPPWVGVCGVRYCGSEVWAERRGPHTEAEAAARLRAIERGEPHPCPEIFYTGGTRRSADGQLNLTASSLQGNLREGFVDLMAPVQVRDPKRKGWMNAKQTRWAINDQLLTSDQPFEGAFNKLQGQGRRFRIDLGTETVFVPEGCQLRQPGEQLTARSCQWNWTTGRFEAEGNVELRRDTYKQITRSSQLQGTIGKDGTAVFRSPGARVNSQFTLPPQQKGQRPKRSTPPVRF